MSYKRLSIEEREEISRSLAKGMGVRAIGRMLRRQASTISREIERSINGRKRYRAVIGQYRANKRASA